MPVIHECAPASPAAKKWHMANPPGVQLHACKCHNLKAATHFFWEAKKNTPVSRIDGLVASGVIGHFFRYMDIMHTHQNCQKCKENNSSFQAISRAFRNCSGSDTPSSWASVASEMADSPDVFWRDSNCQFQD